MKDQADHAARYRDFAEDRATKLRDAKDVAVAALERKHEEMEAAVEAAGEKAKAKAEKELRAELEKRSLALRDEFRAERQRLLAELETANAELEKRSKEASELARERAQAVEMHGAELAQAAKAADEAKEAARVAELRAVEEAKGKAAAEALAREQEDARAAAERKAESMRQAAEEAEKRSKERNLAFEQAAMDPPQPPIENEKHLRRAIEQLLTLRRDNEAADAEASEAARARQAAYNDMIRLEEEVAMAYRAVERAETPLEQKAKEAAADEVRSRLQKASGRYQESSEAAQQAASRRDRLTRQKTAILQVLEDADRANVRALIEMNEARAKAAIAAEEGGSEAAARLADVTAELDAERARLRAARQELDKLRKEYEIASSELTQLREQLAKVPLPGPEATTSSDSTGGGGEAAVPPPPPPPPEPHRFEGEVAPPGVEPSSASPPAGESTTQEAERGIFTSSQDAQKGFGAQAAKAQATKAMPRQREGVKGGAGFGGVSSGEDPTDAKAEREQVPAGEAAAEEVEDETARTRREELKAANEAAEASELAAIGEGATVSARQAFREQKIVRDLMRAEVKVCATSVQRVCNPWPILHRSGALPSSPCLAPPCLPGPTLLARPCLPPVLRSQGARGRQSNRSVQTQGSDDREALP